MIRRVAFKNFKALRDVGIDLDQLTVIAGQSGSGKTSILDGIAHLTRAVRVDPKVVFSGAANIGVIASRGASGALGLGIEGEWEGKHAKLTIEFEAIEDFPFTDTYALKSEWGDRSFYHRRELHEEMTLPPYTGHALADVLQPARALRLDARKLAEPSPTNGVPFMDDEGKGLGAVIAEMAANRPDDLLKLQDALRAVIPGLIRIRHIRASAEVTGAGPLSRPDDATVPWGHQVIFDMAGAPDVPARVVGEGTLLVLGTLAALIGPDRPEVVLLDHVERALNPSAARRFVEQIQLILAEDNNLQIIATSDSPAVLDQVGGAGVRITSLYRDGAAGCVPLVQHPDYELLKDDLKAGEFWLTVGERWVVEPGHVGAG